MLVRRNTLVLNFCLLLLTGSLAACGGENPSASQNAPSSQTDDVSAAGTGRKSADSKGKNNSKKDDASPRRSGAKQVASETETIYYDGRVGDDDVLLQLHFKGNQVSGTIVRESTNKKFKVSGSLDAEGNITLSEFSQSRKEGWMVGTKHRRKRRFSGDYFNANGGKSSFKFSKTSAPDDVDDIYR